MQTQGASRCEQPTPAIRLSLVRRPSRRTRTRRVDVGARAKRLAVRRALASLVHDRALQAREGRRLRVRLDEVLRRTRPVNACWQRCAANVSRWGANTPAGSLGVSSPARIARCPARGSCGGWCAASGECPPSPAPRLCHSQRSIHGHQSTYPIRRHWRGHHRRLGGGAQQHSGAGGDDSAERSKTIKRFPPPRLYPVGKRVAAPALTPLLSLTSVFASADDVAGQGALSRTHVVSSVWLISGGGGFDGFISSALLLVLCATAPAGRRRESTSCCAPPSTPRGAGVPATRGKSDDA